VALVVGSHCQLSQHSVCGSHGGAGQNGSAAAVLSVVRQMRMRAERLQQVASTAMDPPVVAAASGSCPWWLG